MYSNTESTCGDRGSEDKEHHRREGWGGKKDGL